MEKADNALLLLYDLCRLCLDEPGVDNIFKPVDWSQDILFYTGIKITPADQLPQTICDSCRDTMNCIRVLKEIAITNNKRLKQISGYGDGDLLVTGTLSNLISITPRTDDQDNPSIDTRKVSSSEDQSFKNRIIFESDDDDTAKSRRTDKDNRRKRKKSSEKNNCVPKLKVRTDLFDASVSMKSTNKIDASPSSTSIPSKKIEDSHKISTKNINISKSTTSSSRKKFEDHKKSTNKIDASPSSTSSPCKKIEDSHKISTKNINISKSTTSSSRKKFEDHKAYKKKTSVSPSTTFSPCKKHKDGQEISTKMINESQSTNSNPCKKFEESQEASSSKQVPTSTSNETKSVMVDGKVLKVHKYEFECETCHKTYATHKKLYLHQLAHNKKVPCPLCLKKFATKGDLQKHVRSHTGEKPYKCNLCDLSFAQNCTLKAHKEKLHNEPVSQT